MNQQIADYYPISLDIRQKRCLVIGGGDIACRKVRSLLQYGAMVEIISPMLSNDLQELVEKKEVKSVLRKYKMGDLKGAFVVVAATSDVKANKAVAEEASKLGILINVVDVPNLCNFIVPSVLQRGNISIAVSTGGKSPALARKIRTELETGFSSEYATLVSIIADVREELKRKLITVTAETWQKALDLPHYLELLQLGRVDEVKTKLWNALERS